jgi:hypothetical protein
MVKGASNRLPDLLLIARPAGLQGVVKDPRLPGLAQHRQGQVVTEQDDAQVGFASF